MGSNRSAAGGGGDGRAKAGGKKPTVGAFVAQAGLHLKRLELAGRADPFFQKRIHWVAAKAPAVISIIRYSNLFRKKQEVEGKLLKKELKKLGPEGVPYTNARWKMTLTELMPASLSLVSIVGGYALCKRSLGSLSRYFRPTTSPGLATFFASSAGGILFGMSTMKLLWPRGQIKSAKIKANVPLLPGKMPTADAMCEDAMNIYAMAGEEFWDKYRDSLATEPLKKYTSDHIAMLEAIENLALNCARRKAFVKARTGGDSGLRVGSGEKAEFTGESATIPEAGVPEKYPIDKKSIGKDSDGYPATDRWLESITLAMDQNEKFSKKVWPRNIDLLPLTTGGGKFEINKMKTAKDVFKKEKEFQDLRRQYIGRIGVMGHGAWTMKQVQGGMDLPSQTSK